MSKDVNTDLPWLEAIQWDNKGLITTIAQDADSLEVLMVAWMNQESLRLSLDKGEAVYWSRSRNRLWHKGEESGNTQQIVSIRLDCDGDVLLLKVRQTGGIACHTGRKSCFYLALNTEQGQWQAVDPVLKDPAELYQKSTTRHLS
jgi:phosphoribosyl-AMP cyclohydrolase